MYKIIIHEYWFIIMFEIIVFTIIMFYFYVIHINNYYWSYIIYNIIGLIYKPVCFLYYLWELFTYLSVIVMSLFVLVVRCWSGVGRWAWRSRQGIVLCKPYCSWCLFHISRVILNSRIIQSTYYVILAFIFLWMTSLVRPCCYGANYRTNLYGYHLQNSNCYYPLTDHSKS